MTDTHDQAFARAIALHREGRLDQAAEYYRRCLALKPGQANTWSNYGSLLRDQKNFDAAVGAHRRAIELNPDQPSIRSNLANALNATGAFTEALELKRRLVAEDPDDIEQIRTLAGILRRSGLNRDAIEVIDQAEARLGPVDNLILQRALAYLMEGDYRRGFADFEARFGGTEVSLPDNLPWPRWTGQSLAGKCIVVLPEQGFGDTLLASRFLPALKALGAEVHMLVKPPLRRLASELIGLDEMRPRLAREDNYDYYTPAMSIAHFAGMPETGVPPLPRLSIPDDSRARARALVAPYGARFRVGVVWTGSLTYMVNHRRSSNPESFLGLARIPGVQLFSLYKGDGHGDFIASGIAGLIADACGDDRDFADTAAVIDEMDLMITTDTAVVHIAASLGKPVWNMLAEEGFWLYGTGETTQWYPSMRLFRKHATGGWEELFQRVEAALRQHLEHFMAR